MYIYIAIYIYIYIYIYVYIYIYIYISRHTVVCRAAQENRACAKGVSTGTTKSRFSRIHSSVIPDPNDTKFTVAGKATFKI